MMSNNEQRIDDILPVVAQDIKTKLREYAESRKKDVTRGAETPELAALLVQKYGYGLVDAFCIVFSTRCDQAPTYADVDNAVSSIDPDWRSNQQRRWSARPAGLSGLADV